MTSLPISEVLVDIRQSLSDAHELVLQAPPGAGKTTLVPLVLMHEPWLSGKKILMLEPRRIAARNAAGRMASMLGEKPGESVGYRMRLDTRVGPTTVVEVITEGVLSRMLHQDPSLADVGLVIFDEFHERNLDSDLGLALTLHGRSLFRGTDNPLKLLIMSATLQSREIADLLGNAPVITSEGRQFRVDITYTGPRRPRDRIVERIVPAILRALAENSDSSLLVFLPGEGEIRNTADRLTEQVPASDVHIRPLYGNLTLEEQQLAISPAPAGHRKIVLATNIAETSLTIEGVNVIVDSGLAREPQFDPNTGMTRLQTRQISQSSATQRAGRAGRLAPGRCYRLWSEDQQHQLAVRPSPEIENADLAPMVLQLRRWGVASPDELQWLEPPPRGNWLQAVDLLRQLGAFAETGASETPTLGDHGQAMADFPTHPRLAHMLLRAFGDASLNRLATELAAVLSDRDPFGRDNPDMSHRIAVLRGDAPCPGPQRGWRQRTRNLALQFSDQLSSHDYAVSPAAGTLSEADALSYLLACAYPDRVARRRHAGSYQLANGRSASLAQPHYIGKSKWLAVAETGGMARNKGDVIYSAVTLDPGLFDSVLSDLVEVTRLSNWDEKTSRFTAEEQKRIGELILTSRKLDPDPGLKGAALIQLLERKGLDLLCPGARMPGRFSTGSIYSGQRCQTTGRICQMRTCLDTCWTGLVHTSIQSAISTTSRNST